MKKPWPGDSLIIVAPNPGEEIRHADFPTVERNCRDCGQPVVVRTASIAHAEGDPMRCDRPVTFFCIPCAVQYDPKSLDKLTDLRQ